MDLTVRSYIGGSNGFRPDGGRRGGGKGGFGGKASFVEEWGKGGGRDFAGWREGSGEEGKEREGLLHGVESALGGRAGSVKRGKRGEGEEPPTRRVGPGWERVEETYSSPDKPTGIIIAIF